MNKFPIRCPDHPEAHVRRYPQKPYLCKDRPGKIQHFEHRKCAKCGIRLRTKSWREDAPDYTRLIALLATLVSLVAVLVLLRYLCPDVHL